MGAEEPEILVSGQIAMKVLVLMKKKKKRIRGQVSYRFDLLVVVDGSLTANSEEEKHCV